MTSTLATIPALRQQPADKQALLALPPIQRLQSIGEIFLFPRSVGKALKQLEYVFHSRGGRLSSNILLIGPDEVGKTALIRYFASSHPPMPGANFDQQPVVIATPTARTDGVGLAEAILGDGGWPQSLARMGAKLPEIQIEMFLRESKTRILFLNRANLLAQGGSSIALPCAVFLSNLMDRADVSVGLVGDDELITLIRDCKLLKKRFKLRVKLNSIEFGPHWIELLSSVEQRLPFDRTDLLIEDMPLRLHIASDGGKIPPFMRLTFKAAARALLAEKSSHLKRAHFLAAFSDESEGGNPFGKLDPEFARRDDADPAVLAKARAVQANNRDLAK